MLWARLRRFLKPMHYYLTREAATDFGLIDGITAELIARGAAPELLLPGYGRVA
jgi:hypothetical protein